MKILAVIVKLAPLPTIAFAHQSAPDLRIIIVELLSHKQYNGRVIRPMLRPVYKSLTMIKVSPSDI